MINKPPDDLMESLKEYLHKGEKLHDAIEEVYVLNFDFSWVLLTDERIIVSTKRLFDYNFKDYQLSSLDIDISLGFFFDVLEFRIPAKVYTSHFYRFNRKNTLKFFHEVEKKISEEKEGDDKEEKEKPSDRLRELNYLLKEGLLTKEEFEKKRKKILKEL